LAVIEDAKELKYINSLISDGNFPVWTGMKEIKGDIYDLDQKSKIQFSNWDAHLGHGFNTQPNTPYDDVWDCVRMRGGMYNDADCDDNTGRVLVAFRL